MTRSTATRTLQGIQWTALGSGANLLLQLGFVAVMARLLEPALFGLMALCTLVLRLFAYLAQLGIGAALVQRARVEPQDIRLAHGLTWLVGVPVVAVVLLLAPALAALWHNHELVALVRVASLGLLLTGLAAIPVALLRRALRFRAVALVDTAAYLLGYGGVGIGLAWAGAGVWSLVAASLAQSLLTLAVACALARPPWRPSLQGDRRGLLGYGARHSLVTFVEFLHGNLDTALIGRLLGETSLGLYNRAALLSNQPMERAAGVVSRVLFPVMSGLQADRAQVGALFLLGVAGIGVLGAAVSLGLSAAAGDVVAVMLGARWADAAPVVEVLALAVPCIFVSHIAGVTCDAMAWLDFKLRMQAASLALLALLIAAGLRHGMLGVAWALVATEVLRLVAYLGLLGRRLGCAKADLARVALAIGLAGAIGYAGIRVAARLVQPWQPGLPLAFATDLVAGLLALVLAAGLARWLLDGTAPGRLAARQLPAWRRLPPPLRRALP